MQLRSGVVTWFLVAAVLVLPGCQVNAPNEPEPPDSDMIRALTREHPDLLVAVPRELPGPYEFQGNIEVQSNLEGDVVSTSWSYRQSEASRQQEVLPVVEICMVRRGSPWACLPKRRALVVRRLDNATAAVYAMGPGPAEKAAPYWENAELITDWRDATWLHERRQPDG